MSDWNGYHTMWYDCMEMVWLWNPHTIPYGMVSGMVTIPYGMSVWNGIALESTYHTIWYECMEWYGVWNGYHTIWYECMEWYGFGIHISYHMV